MVYIQERRGRLLLEADKVERECFKKQIGILQDYYQKEEVRERVIEAFEKLLEKWDREEPAVSLGVHYLFTSVHQRTYTYLLALYGEEFYLDERAIEISWKPELLIELFEEDVREIFRQIEKQFPRLCAYEKEGISHHCMGYYHAAIYQLCKDIWPEILEREAFQRLKKREDFSLFFGAYRGEGEVIA